jgi:predicted DNA-binding ribbon-helix-helix protein
MAQDQAQRKPATKEGEAVVSETKRDYKRQYRLAKKHWHYQLVRLDHDDAHALKAIAERRNISVAELVRTYIAWGLEEDDSARRPDDL